MSIGIFKIVMDIFQVWLGRMVSNIIPQFPVRALDSKAMSRDKEMVCKKG